MTRKNKDKQIEKLKTELKTIKEDRSSCIVMYQNFLNQSIKRGKTIGILLDLITQDQFEDLLSELYNLRRNKSLQSTNNDKEEGS